MESTISQGIEEFEIFRATFGLSLSGDNDAFGHVVRQYDPSLKEGSSISRTESVESKVSSHIRLIPRCRMNSFGVTSAGLYFYQRRIELSFGSLEYIGDFIAHASGIDRKDVGVVLLWARAT